MAKKEVTKPEVYTLSAALRGEHLVLETWIKEKMQTTLMPTVSSQLIAILHEVRSREVSGANKLGEKNLKRGTLRK